MIWEDASAIEIKSWDDATRLKYYAHRDLHTYNYLMENFSGDREDQWILWFKDRSDEYFKKLKELNMKEMSVGL